MKRILTEDDLIAINRELEKLFQSGVESNKIIVSGLNSKGVQATTNDSIKVNANKIKDIKVGDYSKGDYVPYKNLDISLTSNGVPIRIFKKSINRPTAIRLMGNYIYVGTGSGRLYKLDLNGTTIWNKAISNSSITAIDTDGDKYLYVGFEDTYLRKINANTGITVWSKEGGGGEEVFTIKYKNGYIYLGANHKLSKISDSGKVIWSYQRVRYEPIQIDVSSENIVIVVSSAYSRTATLTFDDGTGERLDTISGYGGGVIATDSGVYLTNNEGNFIKYGQDLSSSDFQIEIPPRILPEEKILKLASDKKGNFLYGLSGNYVVKLSKWGGIIWRTWLDGSHKDMDYEDNLVVVAHGGSVSLLSSFAMNGAYIK